MKSFVLVSLACTTGLALASPPANPRELTTITVAPAPTTTATTTPCGVVSSVAVCPTCTSTQIACIKVSSIWENLPGCPSPAMTAIVDYFCDESGWCPPPSCTTSYVFPDRTTSVIPEETS